MIENLNDKITKNEYFKASDVAEKLEIGDSTVRKYALILENLGVKFRIGNRNARLFSKENIILIGRMSQLLKETDMKPEKAAEAILNQYANEEVASTTELSPNVAGEKQETSITPELLQQLVSELAYYRENAITKQDLEDFKRDATKTIADEVRKEIRKEFTPLLEENGDWKNKYLKSEREKIEAQTQKTIYKERAYQTQQMYEKDIVQQKPEKAISLFQKVKGFFGSN